MTLTVGMLLDEIRHRLGGPVDPLLGGGLRVINLAGRGFYSAHPWRFALRVSTELDTTADQSYVTLPSDYGSLLPGGVVRSNRDLWEPVQVVSPAQMLHIRNMNPPFQWIEFVSVEAQDRLGLFSTPTTSELDHLRITYNARWSDKSQPSDVVPVADWAEAALIEYVREYAAGKEMGGLELRLAAVLAGPTFTLASRADADMQLDLGPMDGGAVNSLYVSEWDGWMRNTVVQ